MAFWSIELIEFDVMKIKIPGYLLFKGPCSMQWSLSMKTMDTYHNAEMEPGPAGYNPENRGSRADFSYWTDWSAYSGNRYDDRQYH